MATILSGTKIAERELFELSHTLGGQTITLAVVQVGSHAVSKKYIQEKKKICRKLGIGFELFEFPSAIDAELLKLKIKEIAKNPVHTGVIIQLPLPKRFCAKEILDCIPKEKDVDVLSSKSFELFKNGKSKIFPPTVCAIAKLFKEYDIQLGGKKILILGRGRLVGQPLEVWLKNQGVTPLVADKSTKDIFALTKKADIIVTATGKTGLLKGSMIKQGAIVIDAGTSIEAGTTRGDVDFKSVAPKASFISPVPGGVGPLTVVCLLQNLLALVSGYWFS